MKRKDFLKQMGLGGAAVVAGAALVQSCNKDDFDPNACETSPVEMAGPFPIKTPAELVQENIIGDRTGIPLIVKIIVENTNADCTLMEGAQVDLWQCDAHGNYSEYSGQQEGDFTANNFLRGRQVTNTAGEASFVSIYPGWYPGRAPHLHVEILKDGTSLLVTQVAFPEDISEAVYVSNGYQGDADTTNKRDSLFKGSLSGNMADSVTGNTNDGYTLTKTIKVSG